MGMPTTLTLGAEILIQINTGFVGDYSLLLSNNKATGVGHLL